MIQDSFEAPFINDVRYAFDKEFLITSGNGLYTASTIGNCNTRKYHALLAASNQYNDDVNILVANIDESVNCNAKTYHLATHKYPGLYHPEGYKFLESFHGSPAPRWVYRMEDVVLSKEMVLSDIDNGILIRYTIEQATAPVEIVFNPLLAFKPHHAVMKANTAINKKITPLTNGISLIPYDNYPELFLQFSSSCEFVQAPDWYYNIEYDLEKDRGYDFHEDLYTPGIFTVRAKKGEQFILYAGLKQIVPATFKRKFTSLVKKMPSLHTMEACLQHAAQQFIVRKNKRTEIIAGYYWFGSWGRDTFISLPGLTLARGDYKTFKDVINGTLPDIKDGVVPNVGTGNNAAYNSVDASLWFVWAIQQYTHYTKDEAAIWKEYGKVLQSILESYRKGTLNNIKMDDDGLVSAGIDDIALTWMDAMINAKAVTPRHGKPVEVNALWYNAVCFCLQLARANSDDKFLKRWEKLQQKIAHSFIAAFWSEERQYLADYIDGDYKDYSVRPNQLFAVSLPYSPLSEAMKKAIIEIVKDELLTPRGLRTLSSQDPNYKGQYTGDQAARDRTYHQGTVWPWLIGAFAEAYLKEYKHHEAISFIEDIYKNFEPALLEKCLYTISEIYSGDAPHRAVGAVAQAWSVAELLRTKNIIAEYKNRVPVHIVENSRI